jgi:hypothetical protein
MKVNKFGIIFIVAIVGSIFFFYDTIVSDIKIIIFVVLVLFLIWIIYYFSYVSIKKDSSTIYYDDDFNR